MEDFRRALCADVLDRQIVGAARTGEEAKGIGLRLVFEISIQRACSKLTLTATTRRAGAGADEATRREHEGIEARPRATAERILFGGGRAPRGEEEIGLRRGRAKE